ncbi:MAG: ABC transporter permease [Candidatus Tectomicrobia bacterium]|nr:ABC transporter permease [Candidatus Tectomicrobia bacterium]
MSRYILRRLLLVIPTLFIVSIIVFSLIRMIPGDVAVLMVENYRYADDIPMLRHKLGLDKPLYEQYLTWVGNMLRGDLGESLWTRRSIVEELWNRIPVSLELGILTIIISLIIALPIGVYSALRQDTKTDYVARSFAIAGLSIPGFWLATMIVVFPAIWFRWSPPLQYVPFSENPFANLWQFAIPSLILGVERSASVMRMTRAMMLEVLRQDYIRTAWSKGLKEMVIVYRHALKNAMIPVITIIGLQIPFIMGGSVIMESIFALPGMGRFMIEVISQRDYPMLQAVNIVFATLVVFTNLLVDITYAYLDPRIRHRQR